MGVGVGKQKAISLMSSYYPNPAPYPCPLNYLANNSRTLAPMAAAASPFLSLWAATTLTRALPTTTPSAT